MSRWLIFLTAIFLLLTLLGLGLLEFLFRWQVEPKIKANLSVQARYFEPYLEDLKYLAKIEIFQSVKNGQSDAGPFLNARLHWVPENKVARNPKAIVPSDIREQILRLQNNWMQKFIVARHWERADLSFFAELGKFDHWDIEAASPIAKLARYKKFVPPPQLPVPDPLDLMTAAKLRLMRGGLEEKQLEALQDTRNLARLLLTTENMQLVLAGIAILDDERRAYRYFVDQMNFPADSWIPIDRNQTRRAYRAMLGTRGFMHLWTSGKVTQAIFFKGPTPPAFCAAANEAFPIEFSIRFMLEPQWPMEKNLRAEYARLDQVWSKAKKLCRLKYLSKLKEADAFDFEIPGPLFMSTLPYARKVMGLRISALSFSGFEPYATTLGK